MTTPQTAAGPTSRCWTLRSAEGTVDVEVVAPDDAPLAAVLPALGRVLGAPVPGLWAGSARLADDTCLTAPALAHGAVLGLGGPAPRERGGQRSSALELHVVGGPEAGRTLPLSVGRHVVGRGAEATLPLDDPDVSRRHVVLEVGGTELTVRDLASTNGSTLDGEELDGRPRPWPTGAVLRLGSTAMTVTGPAACPSAVYPAPGGRLTLRPATRLNTPRAEVPIVFPRAPQPPPRRRLALVAVVLPAVAGVLMAVLLHAPQFLFFACLSPVMALGTWLSERWSGRRSSRREAAAYEAEALAARARVAEAVRGDVHAAESAHPSLAALTSAARRRTSLLWGRRRSDVDALTLRLGTGPGSTRVVEVRPDGSRAQITAEHLPVTVDLRASGGLAVVGPRGRTSGILAGLVAQLAGLHAPGELDLVLLVSPECLPDWRWARWLPHLRPSAVRLGAGSDPTTDDELRSWLGDLVAYRRGTATGRAASAGAAAHPGWLVVVVDRPVDAATAAALQGARDAGVVVLTAAESVEELPVHADAVLTLTGETGDTGILGRQGIGDAVPVTVDRLPPTVAAAFARDLAPLRPGESGADLPRRVRLLDLPGPGLRLDGAQATGAWSRTRDSLVTTVGRGADATVEVDLCGQGPHALVAGTTGSGKSELLQTLIAGLALAYPPDRCSFLLIDYKGGAAFAEAAGLPHTVGVVTDLDGQTTSRALRSLTAELIRREALLAAHGVADVASLPDEVDLARLVIVVDEFATLAEELPAFVPGLVGIAQRGRSLGVHLVLATQRPAGVVSPEIRANCTLRICLRTTDEADSRDVLGVPSAAHLPVDLPGRAYVRTGSSPPTVVQVARVGGTETSGGSAEPVVRRWVWPWTGLPGRAEPAAGGPSDLARITAALQTHAAGTGARIPHRPWRPPLPERVAASELDDPATGALREALGGIGALHPGRLRIGVVDRPDAQAWDILELDLGDGGGWLAVGAARSGRTTLLRTVLGEAVRAHGPDRLHVHVLDHGGGALARDAALLPHTGTAVGSDDALRTVRLLDRLAEEVAARRAGPQPASAPALLLLVDGVESVVSQLDEYDPMRGSAALLRLVRDGAAVGLTCVLTADRAVPGGRLAAVARRRLVLPLPDRADYAMAGTPARAVPTVRPAGRALVDDDALECQLALPRPWPAGAATAWESPTGDRPLRIPELPAGPVLPLPRGTRADGPGGRLLLPVGPGGDEGVVLEVDLLRSGGLLVAGPPGSGRSTALEAFAAHLRAIGVPVVRLGHPGRSAAHGETPLDPADAGGLRAWLAGLDGRPGVVMADDLGLLGDCPALSGPAQPGAPVVLIAAASAGELSRQFQGPVAALRRNRTGLLLCPGPGDADLLGIRLPRTPVPVRPGSGWLVVGGAVQRVQVARREPAARHEPAVRAAATAGVVRAGA